MKKLTTEEVIVRSKIKHGDIYNYDKTVYLDSKTKITVTCKIHGDFTLIAHSHMNGTGCAKCSGKYKKTNDIFIKESKNIHGEEAFNYSKLNYKNINTKVILICKNNHEIEVLPNNHLNGFGCAVCAGINKFTQQEYIEKVNCKHDRRYDYSLTKYENSKSKVKIICKEHGIFEQAAGAHLRGQGCPKCSGKNKNNLAFIEESKLKHINDSYDYSLTEYKGSKIKVKIICKKHGVFEQTPNSHLRGRGCPTCYGAIKHTTNSLVNKSNIIHNFIYDYHKTKYGKNNRDPVIIICKKHGEFKQTPMDHLNGNGCPKCVNLISTQEDKLHKEFVFFSRTCKDIIKPYHLDLYSKKYNLAIEVNGRYWHSSTKKGFTYHLKKTEMCESKNIQLLHFWDNEIDLKFPIVKSMVKAKLGELDRIYARKTKLHKITRSETDDFLGKNHIQGFNSSITISYGLYYDNELISVMGFGKPRFSKKYEYELVRFATKLDFIVVGGASKLFKKFVNDHNPKTVVSYADRRYSNGKVYKYLGFIHSHNSEPNYFYSKGDNLISRYSAQKHKLSELLKDTFNKNLSETENMVANGFHKVYDCGNKVFVWRSL